ADGVSLAQLEIGDRLPCPGDHWLLAGDHRQVFDCTLQQGRLLSGAPDAHVDDDLLEPRYLHDVRHAELVLEARPDLRDVTLLQTGRWGAAVSIARRSVPAFLQARSFRPVSSKRNPTRVAPQVEHTT